ncbi:MAG: ATP-binding cassette domain-containing protein [Pyrinomonadaceae bacterium]
MSDNNHQEVISRITQKEFQVPPIVITRMTNGVCNEVYTVDIGGREIIVRLNTEPRFMLGSHNHIPLFRSKGVSVPEILAEDFSKTFVHFAYQVQSKIEGRDITDVIADLSDEQLKAIGGEIANVFRKLSDVPNNGKFGVVWGDERDLVDSWSSEVARVTKVVIGWGKGTGVLNKEIEDTLNWINTEYKSYFERVRPYTYFGDLSSKNVMIRDGRFVGLVDLDSLAQGDPLEAIGRIKASWYGTRHGKVYSDAVMDSLGLSGEQRKIVTMYALLNRAFWTLENGVQFNQNTSRTVDREREAEDKKAVAGLSAELRGTVPKAEPPPIESRPEPIVIPEQPARSVVPPPPMPEPEAVPQSTPTPTPVSTEPVLSELPTAALVDVLPAEHATGVSWAKIMLETSGLSKTYTSDGIGFNALKDVDLRIRKGDCIAIVGKSGSGKSTLMHLLACLDQPTEGYVYVDGDETSTMTEPEKNQLRNEKFGFVFQQFFLNGRDTVFENVVLPMRIRGASEYDLATDAEAALAAVGLSDKSDKKAKDLSGGEKQRVCIARALVGKPQVIFADEPTGNLDSTTGAAIENMLFDLNRDQGITLVIVTHDPDLSERCERVVEMKDGRIIAERRGEAFN